MGACISPFTIGGTCSIWRSSAGGSRRARPIHREEEPCTCEECTGDFLTVTAADALAMAEALERMLPYLPNEEVVAVRYRVIPWLAWPTPMSELDVPQAAPTRWFGGSHRANVEALIRFCRRGVYHRVPSVITAHRARAEASVSVNTCCTHSAPRFAIAGHGLSLWPL